MDSGLVRGHAGRDGQIICRMKVLDLQCAHQHVFEGWFSSEEDFRHQLESGLLGCPVCGDQAVHKRLSAPRLNLAHAPEPAQPAETRPAESPEVQGQLLQALREVMKQTEDVGERFADEARAMHHGDIEQRNIRGRTTPEVARELVDEGIEVMPLPALPVLKETLQ